LIGPNHIADGIEEPILHHEVIACHKVIEKLLYVANIVRFEVIAICLCRLRLHLLVVLRLLQDNQLLSQLIKVSILNHFDAFINV
jgi:hypothetical protein